MGKRSGGPPRTQGANIPDDKGQPGEGGRNPASGAEKIAMLKFGSTEGGSVRAIIEGTMVRLKRGDAPDLFDLEAHLPVVRFEDAEAAGIAREWTEADELKERNELAKNFLLAGNYNGFNELRKTNPDWQPDLSETQLSDCDLHKFKLDGATFNRAVMRGADLAGMFLDGAQFNGAIMDDVKLERSQMQGVFMIGAVLRCAHLDSVDLKDSRLTRADLTGATLKGALVSGAEMYATILYGADLSGTKGLNVEQLSKACFGGAKVDRTLYLAAVSLIASGRKPVDREILRSDFPGSGSGSGSREASFPARKSRLATPPIRSKVFPSIDILGSSEAFPTLSPEEVQLNVKAKKFLVDGNAAEFNDLRAQHPAWEPNLDGINLMKRNLSGFDLGGGVSLRRAILVEVNFLGGNLEGAKLDMAVMSGAKLENVNLRGASMVGAMLCMTNLQGANLGKAVLRQAEMTRCYLTGADLLQVDLYGAALKDAQFSDVKNLTPEQLCTAAFGGAHIEKELYSNAVELLNYGYKM